MTFDILLDPYSVVTPYRPIWFFVASLSIPLGDTNVDAFEFACAVAFTFRIQIQLYRVFNPVVARKGKKRRRRRSIQEDQRDLFSQIEEGLTAAGIDGHACVLRFICEMQTNAFSPSSIFGEVFNLVFTPKPGGDSSVLEEYIKAKATGQDYGESGEAAEERGPPMCAQRYASCPMSVFSYLKRLRGSHRDHAAPEDRPGG
ncbi:uncharacterized protein LOC127003166 isoform X1 [Eriocheir sinensis]|uniref:uncharacterized protein LOC127003166 isoform X1 n=1 Tax=Eriocheir sinensis TaxID=95602 RepID=UPI0021C7D379|nr:uncharacterized protein LOC127003166 isoform X1 [Eriocheir sinensis]